MSALRKELAQIKASTPSPQASVSVGRSWAPGISVSGKFPGDAGGLGGAGRTQGF